MFLLLELEAEETVILTVVHCPVLGCLRLLGCRKYLVVVFRWYPCC